MKDSDYFNPDTWKENHIKEDMVRLQTTNQRIGELIFEADTAAHAVGSVVFEKEDVERHRERAQRLYNEAIELEPENPHLWWKKAWYLSAIGKDGSDELKEALLNVIKFSRNKKYTHTDMDVRICKYALEKDYGITTYQF